MSWQVTDLGFRMGLHARVPDVLARHVVPLVHDLLAADGLEIADVTAWAVHPGGPRILDVVANGLGLGEADLAASRNTLAEHGNCSSPTVLLTLSDLLKRPDGLGGPAVALAFGPGLTLYGALLR
jgi:alkylresorcinol/alkylpyrone synthase